MKDAWVPVIGAVAVAVISLAGAVYVVLHSPKQKDGTSSAERLLNSMRWNQVVAILAGAATVIATDHFWHLDWYFAIPLGVLAYCAVRFPAYVRHKKAEAAKSAEHRD
jgi:hypothetical protein